MQLPIYIGSGEQYFKYCVEVFEKALLIKVFVCALHDRNTILEH